MLHLSKHYSNIIFWGGYVAISSAVINKSDHTYTNFMFVINRKDFCSVCFGIVTIEQNTTNEYPDNGGVVATFARTVNWGFAAVFIMVVGETQACFLSLYFASCRVLAITNKHF